MSEQAAGARIKAARKSGGVSQKELAAKLGIPLWKMELLEEGELDPAPHLEALAAHTGRPVTWFRDENSQSRRQAAGDDAPRPANPDPRLAREIQRLKDKLERGKAERARLRAELATARERLDEAQSRAGALEGVLDEPESATSGPGWPLARGAKGHAPVSLRSATFEELRGLGMSVTQAVRTLRCREQGTLASVEDLDRVPGLPEQLRATIRERLRD